MLRVFELNVKNTHLPNRKLAQMRSVYFEVVYKVLEEYCRAAAFTL